MVNPEFFWVIRFFYEPLNRKLKFLKILPASTLFYGDLGGLVFIVYIPKS